MFNKRRRRSAVATGATAIRADNLGKRYLKREASLRPDAAGAFWALRHVDFEIRQGEVLGIIGRNGSGKSTLLKILSSVTPPTEGSAEVHGRVGSLLEIGTGFHPDLSGRDNIFLAGSLLGISRSEIATSVESIIEFSGVEPFIDVPVKRYSSGMYVRLAYSVAALLRSDILILDEVLSVGDAEFQKKTRQHIETLTQDGRTILLVSHAMEAVQKYCDWCLWLDDGVVKEFGPVAATTGHYLEQVDGNDPEALSQAPAIVELTNARSFYPVREHNILTSIGTYGRDGRPARVLHVGEPLTLEIGYQCPERQPAGYLTVFFLWPDDRRRMVLYTGHDNVILHLFGQGRVVCRIPELRLVPGVYTLMLDYGHLDFDRFVSLDCLVEATRIRVEGNSWDAAEPEDPGQFLQTSQWRLVPA